MDFRPNQGDQPHDGSAPIGGQRSTQDANDGNAQGNNNNSNYNYTTLNTGNANLYAPGAPGFFGTATPQHGHHGYQSAYLHANAPRDANRWGPTHYSNLGYGPQNNPSGAAAGLIGPVGPALNAMATPSSALHALAGGLEPAPNPMSNANTSNFPGVPNNNLPPIQLAREIIPVGPRAPAGPGGGWHISDQFLRDANVVVAATGEIPNLGHRFTGTAIAAQQQYFAAVNRQRVPIPIPDDTHWETVAHQLCLAGELYHAGVEGPFQLEKDWLYQVRRPYQFRQLARLSLRGEEAVWICPNGREIGRLGNVPLVDMSGLLKHCVEAWEAMDREG
ncbi:hypothetical protein F5X99DRAFT_157765 [Biscogniauxia marginata]|nr:hypothetical protein F5X99DRAFT_157765 [Biscogniauxia marginata]